MSGDAHVRICESLGVQFPRATRLVIKIRGRRHWLWRAVDDEGEVLDFLVQRRRCARSAGRLRRKLLKKQGFAPKRITTDKLKSYSVAIRKERLSAVHDQGCERTIGRRIHTSRFGGGSENSSASSRQDQRNAFCRSTPPFRTPSTFKRHLVPRRIFKDFPCLSG